MRLINPSNDETFIEIIIDRGARGQAGLPGPPGPPGEIPPSSSIFISQAADMNMQGGVAGNFMRWNGSSFVLATTVLDDHLDVTASAPNNGDALIYNGTAWTSGSVSGGSGVYVLKNGDTMTGQLDMTSHKIIGVTNPTNPQEAATKSYVDTTVIASGTLILSGTGIPGAGTGAETNYYVDTTNKALYGPKTGSTWPLNIKGLPSGGATNTVLSKSSATDYATGWNALPASSLTLTGSGPPVEATGTNGNYYSDTLSGILYGPKASVSYGPRIFQVTTNPSSGGIVSPSTGQLRIYRTGSDAVDYGPIMEQHLKIGSRIKLVTGGRTHAATISSGGSPSGAWTWVEIGLDVWPVTAWTNGETVVSNLNSATTGDAHWPVTVKLDNYAPNVAPSLMSRRLLILFNPPMRISLSSSLWLLLWLWHSRPLLGHRFLQVLCLISYGTVSANLLLLLAQARVCLVRRVLSSELDIQCVQQLRLLAPPG